MLHIQKKMCSLQTETKHLIMINLKLRMKPEHIRNACQTKMVDVKSRPKSLCDSRDGVDEFWLRMPDRKPMGADQSSDSALKEGLRAIRSAGNAVSS